MSNMLKGKLVIKGEKGERGYSAYEIAVQNGFEGSENEWLESLEGKSAYEIALNHGFEGTEEEWVDLLQKHREDYESALEQLKEELANAENGSAYVLKKDIVVLTKNIIATPHNATNADFDFPDGFTKSNCICISYNFRDGDDGAESYGDSELYAIQHLNIYNSGITYALQNNSDNDINATVRVVLMKIQ